MLEAHVHGKPDPKWGEVPCAFIELKDNAQTSEADIIAFCRAQMPGFKTPKAVVFGPIPKTSTSGARRTGISRSVPEFIFVSAINLRAWRAHAH